MPSSASSKPTHLDDKTIVLIGGGISNLVAAYELCAVTRAKVVVLEATSRAGGRCLKLRTGDRVTEDRSSALRCVPSETQTVHFDCVDGDDEPYFNAGAARIPSSHFHVLHYLRLLRVPVEHFVERNDAALIALQAGPLSGQPVEARTLGQSLRGYVAELVSAHAEHLLQNPTRDEGNQPFTPERIDELATRLRALMSAFGGLNGDYVYKPEALPLSMAANGSDRAGYSVPMGLLPGKAREVPSLETLLDSEFWKATRFFEEQLRWWQPGMLQIRGGSDRLTDALHAEATKNGAEIRLETPVKKLDVSGDGRIKVSLAGGEDLVADFVLSSMAMPFLELLATPAFLEVLDRPFCAALRTVFEAQKCDDATKRFLAPGSKVGWQARRALWEGAPLHTPSHPGKPEAQRVADRCVHEGTFGGISRTDHAVFHIWYPSEGLLGRDGILTGAFGVNAGALRFGEMACSERLRVAREGAALFGDEFSSGLRNGVSIAWQNMPYFKGARAQWRSVFPNSPGDTPEELDRKEMERRRVITTLASGSALGDGGRKQFFVVGDQVTALAGWLEGAVVSALHTVSIILGND